jgi:diacylglycerol kinase family enzyme
VRARDLPRLAIALSRGAPDEKGFVVVHDAGRIVVRCDRPLPLQVDGEDLGDVDVAVFESEPAAVRALVPR